MKVLLLSVALLFFTGAQGRSFWQQDEPHQEPKEDKSVERILQDAIGIVTGVFKHLDYSEIAEQYKIKEKLEAAKKNANKLEKAIESYFEDVYKKFDEQLHEKFPVFRGKVVPMLKEFDDALEEQLKKVVKEVVPLGSQLVSGISKHFLDFCENLESAAEKGRDAIRAEIDRLRVNVQPYVEEVHAEYEKYRNNLHGELQKDYKEMKEDVEKRMEKMKEQAQPHYENLRKKFSDGKEMQEYIEKFLKELEDALKVLE